MVSATIFAFVSALAMATSASAHMQMTSPPPFRSKWNPNVKEVDYDYSMTAPLGDYPCKGYIDPTAPSVATWAAGSTINYELAGTAVHGGGSCQIVMSYDMGKTWNVIYSIMGGCVIESLTEAVTIPKEAPSGEALFGWNWFNKLGNREMYQNCAVVTITGGGSGFDSDDFPEPFVANVAAAPGCGTQEGIEVVFPKPGKNVKYGGMYASGGATPGAGITGTCAAGAIAPPSAGTSSPASAPSPSAVVSAPVGGETLYAPSSAANPATSPAIPSAAASSASAPSSVVSQAAASSAPASPPKKCKRRRDKLTAPAPARRHERLVRRSAHERLVRRRIQRDISAEQLSL